MFLQNQNKFKKENNLSKQVFLFFIFKILFYRSNLPNILIFIKH